VQFFKGYKPGYSYFEKCVLALFDLTDGTRLSKSFNILNS
jgi:hypothetical protein